MENSFLADNFIIGVSHVNKSASRQAICRLSEGSHISISKTRARRQIKCCFKAFASETALFSSLMAIHSAFSASDVDVSSGVSPLIEMSTLYPLLSRYLRISSRV